MFSADRAKPVLTAHRVDVARFGALRRKPVWPFPAELAAEHRAAILEAPVKRGDNPVAAALIFLVGEGDRVVLAVGLERAVPHPVAIAMVVCVVVVVVVSLVVRCLAALCRF